VLLEVRLQQVRGVGADEVGPPRPHGAALKDQPATEAGLGHAIFESCVNRAALRVESVGLGNEFDDSRLPRPVLADEDRQAWGHLEPSTKDVPDRRDGPRPPVELPVVGGVQPYVPNCLTEPRATYAHVTTIPAGANRRSARRVMRRRERDVPVLSGRATDERPIRNGTSSTPLCDPQRVELPPEDRPDTGDVGPIKGIPIFHDDDPRLTEERASWSAATRTAQALRSSDELISGMSDPDWRVRHETVDRLIARAREDNRTLPTLIRVATTADAWQLRDAVAMRLHEFDRGR
jgi:hypothetical protein